MILYVDETENDDFFIVCGLLVSSVEVIETSYKHFKKAVKNYPISDNEKQIVFKEFKSVLLDRKYQRIKLRLLTELNKIDNAILYSCYIKKSAYFPQSEKESVYIQLLQKIVSAIDQRTEIVFDSFNKLDFENKIISEISTNQNVISIIPLDSQNCAGLQFVDNLCSIIRLKKSNKDAYFFYKQIENSVIEI